MWLFIHAGIKVNPCEWKGSQVLWQYRLHNVHVVFGNEISKEMFEYSAICPVWYNNILKGCRGDLSDYILLWGGNSIHTWNVCIVYLFWKEGNFNTPNSNKSYIDGNRNPILTDVIR